MYKITAIQSKDALVGNDGTATEYFQNIYQYLVKIVNKLSYYISPVPTTVAKLPTAGKVGRRCFVTDATATSFATIVAGSGANAVPVYDDGANWRIG